MNSIYSSLRWVMGVHMVKPIKGFLHPMEHPEKKSSLFLSFSLLFSFSFILSILLFFDFFLPFIYTIKVIYIHLYFYLSHIYSSFTTRYQHEFLWSYLTMSNLTKLEFVALDILGKNYLSWILDAEIHLDAMNLGVTIKKGNQASL